MKRGYHLGFVASTDHHAGFPGSYGDGMAAVVAEQKTRESLWEAIKARRTYAVTGDKILCEFKVNGAWMGSEITSNVRQIKAHVETEGLLDKIVLYKNGKPYHVINGEMYQNINEEGSYKLRVEMGWGKGDLYHWDGRISVEDGEIESYNTYFRGRSVLAPSKDEAYDEMDINDICTEACLRDEKTFTWSCDTVGNKSTLHPSTSSVVVKVKGSLHTKVSFQLNDKTYTATIEELIEHGYTNHMEYYHSQAFKIYKAVPETQYAFELELEDSEPVKEWDYYQLEVSQKNRQWAYISPVYVKKE